MSSTQSAGLKTGRARFLHGQFIDATNRGNPPLGLSLIGINQRLRARAGPGLPSYTGLGGQGAVAQEEVVPRPPLDLTVLTRTYR